jgi:enoyl-CoA hydratase
MSFTGDFIDAQTADERGLVVEVVPHEELMSRAREIASTVTSLPAANVCTVRRLYDEVATLSGNEAWTAEARASREWMEQRFDRSRLEEQRAAIIARGKNASGP